MIYFRVKLDIPTNLLNQPCREAETWLAEEILKDTDKFVPALTKSQANRAHPDIKRMVDRTHIEGSTVIYPGPYARYLYYGKKMVDRKTGKGPMRFADKNGIEMIRFHKGAKLVPTNENLKFNKSVNPKAQSHWFEASKALNAERWVASAAKIVRDELDK